MVCTICGCLGELRENVCFDCAEAESIIYDGTDMYDNPAEGVSEARAITKLQYLIQKGWFKAGKIKAAE